MSHFATINTRVKDIDALRSACAELGVSLEHNTTARGFGGNHLDGDFVLRLKGPYDVALRRDKNTGDYTLHADLWKGHVENELGQNFGRLKQLYGIHKATLEARRKGMNVRRRQLPNGTIRLAICRV